HGGTVLVVREALDEHRHAVGAVALVHDRVVLRPAGFGAGATLDRAVDVVVGDRGLLRLLDGVVERRVAGRVTAAHPGRDLDVLDELGEELAAASVDHGLLVLRGRPLGMSGHAAVLAPSVSCALGGQAGRAAEMSPPDARTRSTKNEWTRASPPTSGWNAVATSGPCRTATILPTAGSRARTSTPAPTSSTQGARMNTPGTVPTAAAEPVSVTAPSNDDTWRPKALRRTV